MRQKKKVLNNKMGGKFFQNGWFQLTGYQMYQWLVQFWSVNRLSYVSMVSAVLVS